MSFLSFHLDRIRPDKFKLYEQDENGRGFVAADENENGMIYRKAQEDARIYAGDELRPHPHKPVV